MKPLPNISDEAAMLLRGKQSAIGSARNDAAAALRDACTSVQGADWAGLVAAADEAIKAAERLKTVSALWHELHA